MSTTPQPTELLTSEETAERLRVAPSTLDYWRRHGRGPAFVRLAKRVMYRAEDVDVWLASQVVPPDDIGAQVRRRREAADRLPPYDEHGHRDPLDRRTS